MNFEKINKYELKNNTRNTVEEYTKKVHQIQKSKLLKYYLDTQSTTSDDDSIFSMSELSNDIKNTGSPLKTNKNKEGYYRKSKNDPYMYVSDEDAKKLVDVINTLYKERLRPYWREIFRHLEQLNTSKNIILNYKTAYESRSDLFIVTSSSKIKYPWAVYLREEPKDFEGWIDPYDPIPPYDMSVWQTFINYLINIMTDNSYRKSVQYTYRGGRYLMAKSIKSSIPEFRSLTLGHICHIVQRAVDFGLLQYEDDVLQPIAACPKASYAVISSLGILKEKQISKEESLTPSQLGYTKIQNGLTLTAISSIELAKELIHKILKKETQGILIGQLKIKLLDKYNVYIRPTHFGFTRLSPMLSSIKFADTCRIFHDVDNRLFVQSIIFVIPPNVTIFVPNKRKKYLNDIRMDYIAKDNNSNYISFLFWSNSELNIFNPNSAQISIWK